MPQFRFRSSFIGATERKADVLLLVWIVLVFPFFMIGRPGWAQSGDSERSLTIAKMETPQDVEITTGSPTVVKGPQGGKVLRFDGKFEGKIDLASRDVDIRNYDLLKIQVKADRGARLDFQLENYPDQGDIANWFVLDTQRGSFDWKTIWVDLYATESTKEAGEEKEHWLDENTEGEHSVLTFRGNVKDLKSEEQGPGRRIWLGDLRAVKKAVHLDWDQRKVSYTGGSGGDDLEYTYPLTVRNELDRSVTAQLSLEPFEVDEAQASLDKESVTLSAKETKTVEATVSLPAPVANTMEPLYCERFSAYARVKEIADSRVTILRSADPIHLTVTVPVPEEQLEFPIFTPPSDVPNSVLQFDRELAREVVSGSVEQMIRRAKEHGIYDYGSQGEIGYNGMLVSAAYLYDFTGEERYFRKAKRLLAALPEIWKAFYRQWKQREVHDISSGIVARWNDGHHYTLGLGWKVMGTQRGPYHYGKGGNGAGGSMSSISYAFDFLAPELDSSLRQKIIHEFLVPAGIQCRNHYIGDGNQQATANSVAMYAGLVSRNWPLVSFAYSSEHGLKSIMKWSFDDDGVQLRKNYQTYTLRPILWMAEMLYGVGINFYQSEEGRLIQLINAEPAKKGMGSAYHDPHFWTFLKKNRLK